MAKVALFSFDVVGRSMAGPAIRYWEFANGLAKRHDVTLFIPNKPEKGSPIFSVKQHGQLNLKDTDVLIAQEIGPRLAFLAKKNGVKIILDAYDPMPLENLEIFKQDRLPLREWRNHSILENFHFSFHMADAIICATEKQRDLWLGLLINQKRLSPLLYDLDPTLKHLIDIVPFGLSSTPPKINGDGIRKMFHLKKEDKIILWGGGIWNWFDPLTLIEAINLLRKERNDIYLVFMGIKHPNECLPEMKMTAEAVKLSRTLGLYNNGVFFNDGWIPYDQRQNFLLESDVGVSTHFENLEARFAFRTRLLDYIWAGIPIVATEGDFFAELIARHHLGIVVPYRDKQALAQALKRIVSEPQLSLDMKKKLEQIRPTFYWETLLKPLDRMIEQLSLPPKEKLSAKETGKILSSLWARKGPKALLKRFRASRN